MRKILFNDKYGLTDAVLEGRKTMWRSVFDYETYRKLWEDMCRLGTPCFDTFDDFLIKRKAKYEVGEVVAVAQSYKDAGIDPHFLMFQPIKGSTYFAEMEIEAMFTGGWNNKMFVRADLMPHQIKITDIKVERLRDISSKDILKEGFVKVKFDVCQGLSVVRTMSGYTLPQWKESFEDPWQPTIKGSFSAESPDVAISVLLYYLGGKDERFLNENPYVFAYTFELEK